jgi:hypothetical protein
MYSGFVKSEAIANQIYMNPLTKREVVAQCLTDLASAYTKKYGYEDFVLKCTFLAHQHGLKSMSIHKHNFNYYLTLHNYILEQYKKNGLTGADFKADKKAMNIYNQVAGAKKHIDIMGYADMPPDQYEKWLNSVKSESQKQEHRNRMRSLMSQLD